MSSQKQHVTFRDLAEEAKKRIVFLVICVVGLSYLMSLTSSSVWMNLPAAALLILVLRYLSLDFETKRKAAVYSNKPSPANNVSQKKPVEKRRTVDKSEWRRKVNSPSVESAIDHFTRHIVSEWVTDLWYAKLTPDKEGPDELVYIMNGVFGEFSARMRNINLIDLMTRDFINLICTHLELFRATQVKIEKQEALLTIEHRDVELKLILAAEDKLHPALFSAEAEHKVLQHLMDGIISLTFKPEDLQCAFFRCVTRELLACAVMRPVLNLANPRFINERIENVVINMNKSKQAASAVHDAAQQNPDGLAKISSDPFSLDPSATGVELVQLKNDRPKKRSGADENAANKANGNLSKDPLLSIDTRTTRTWNSFPTDQTNDEGNIQRHRSGGEWGDMLDIISHRKKEALAPENFENMWTKGKDYKRTEGENRSLDQAPQGSSQGKLATGDNSKFVTKPKESVAVEKHTDQFKESNSSRNEFRSLPCASATNSYLEDDEEISLSSASYTSEEEECVTGLDSPGTKVWDGRSNRNAIVSQIHHPLENSGGRKGRKVGKGHARFQRLQKAPSRKRSRPSNIKVNVWQEIQRTSFLSGDGQDILGTVKGNENNENFNDDSDPDSLGRIQSGAAASSSTTPAEGHGLVANSLKNSLAVDSFYKLRCEVLGANIVKSGSRTFAVYSVSVTDVNNHSWSIKRRFRHFEELHRRLKMFSEYNLHLPPKHFLSTGLDIPVIRERCKLLDNYLKKLMQLPTVSGSIEVWDFLSVDSQTYFFSNSFSIIDTLSVDLDGKPSEKSKGVSSYGGPSKDQREPLRRENPPQQMKNNTVADGFKLNPKSVPYSPSKSPAEEYVKPFDNSGSDSEIKAQKDPSSPINLGKGVKGRESTNPKVASELILDAATDPTLPKEWVPPNVSVPILDLVDCIFQLQDGGWIRRKAFWVAKQVLQLGMGDAFDDWLIEKIQLLRKGPVVASGVKRLEQILWPDGIFLTKHPKRRRQPQPASSPNGHISSPRMGDDEQQQEAKRRAKFVYELMIDKAPAAIVGLVGRREYEQCAKDLYFFLQSSVCLKLLAFDLLELLLLSTFPEMDDIFRQIQDEKHRFGEFKPN